MKLFHSRLAMIATTKRSAIRLRMLVLDRRISWRHRLRPGAYGVIGLATAIVLWGVGYRLSRYHSKAIPSPVPIVRLWIETRHASVTAALGFKVRSHVAPEPQPAFVTRHQLPNPDRAVAFVLCRRQHDAAQFNSATRSRAPPPARSIFV